MQIIRQSDKRDSSDDKYCPDPLPTGINYTNFTTATLKERLSRGIDPSAKQCITSLIEKAPLLYNPQTEFARMGIPDESWRMTEVNMRYKVCPTYPQVLVVPALVNDATLVEAAKYRSKSRMVAFCWRHPGNKCSITRSSQPMTGLTGARNRADEYLLNHVNRANGEAVQEIRNKNGKGNVHTVRPLIIYDARPLLNAQANQASGKGGYEAEKNYESLHICFLDIENIHVMRTALEKMSDAAADEVNWSKNMLASGWLGHISMVLKGVSRIVHTIAFENLAVHVHCSDGWDRTSQLTSISMLCLDGYYRTMEGFIVLIQKEWFSFGHKFAERLGWNMEGWKSSERSPIFHQFIDCTYQLMQQNPYDFEFTEDMLIFILDSMYSGWFVEFMFDTERERKEFHTRFGIISPWVHILGNREKFRNWHYSPRCGVLIPQTRSMSIIPWHAWFFRYHDAYSKAAWLQETGFYVNTDSEAATTSSARKCDPNACKKCKRAFSKYIKKHRCRRCGDMFCDKCASIYRIVEAVSTWRPSRVCGACSVIMDKEIREKEKQETVTKLGKDTLKAQTPLQRHANNARAMHN
jgi:hypothetical protein